MQAVIELSDDEWNALRSATQIDEANEAVRAAVAEYVRRAAAEQLIQLAGKITIQDNWRNLEKAELEE